MLPLLCVLILGTLDLGLGLWARQSTGHCTFGADGNRRQRHHQMLSRWRRLSRPRDVALPSTRLPRGTRV